MVVFTTAAYGGIESLVLVGLRGVLFLSSDIIKRKEVKMKKEKAMSFQDKLELIQSACRVADFWEVEPADLLAWVAIGKKDKVREWNKIAEEVGVFDKASLEERAEMLGVKLIKK